MMFMSASFIKRKSTLLLREAARRFNGLRNDESVCTAELRLDKEDLLPREIRLLLLRYRKGEEL